MPSSQRANALADETSPYLLQHADNPVDWYPWGPEALDKARREHKPILLSIGYSACHWCHVMAHESFEDEATASLMNALFVNIKVDREERPDVDRIYQTAHQLLTRRGGGWPLTMFLTPQDNRPFFGGTYFPDQPRHGMPGFSQVLQQVARFHAEHQADIDRQNASLMNALESLTPRPGNVGPQLTPAPLHSATAQLLQQLDREHGGFGGAPKFPHPVNIEHLLRQHASPGSDDDEILHAALLTLRKMALGGLYDQIGGGFSRYSVDELWMIPHFEKMLYDNGPLLALYAQAWQITGEDLFRNVGLETGRWTLREMQSPDGGYYSSLDADSEGEEGKFYVWSRDEIRRLLDADEYAVAALSYGLDDSPNFEDKAWHLHVHARTPEIAQTLGIDQGSAETRLNSARQKLFEARRPRIRPGLDDKILTSWNGLMIKGMALAGRIFKQPELLDSATRALDFVKATLWTNGRLLATCKDGKARLPAYLDDYAFLVDGILTLLQARWRDEDFLFALALADVLVERFQDPDEGGFFFTADDHESLIYRPKPVMDDALPSGNGIAAQALQRLGHLTGETLYVRAAERTLQLAWSSMEQIPYAHAAMLLALEEYLSPPQMVVIRGEPGEMEPWLERCHGAYAPHRLVFGIPAGSSLPGALAQREARDGTVAYVCEGFQCRAPIADLSTLERELGGPA